MKRMKALLGVVLVIAMVLSLGLTAIAAEEAVAGGKIIVAEPGEHTYYIYKVFDVKKDGDDYIYYASENLKKAINGEITGVDGYAGLTFTDVGGNWRVDKGPGFSAADFAKWLLTDNPNGHDNTTYLTADTHNSPGIPGSEMKAGHAVENGGGYYFITYDNKQPYALTNVLGADSQIQNKHDTPFDKHVYKEDGHTTDINEQSVKGGQTLYYEITGKVPNTKGNDKYLYKVWDKLGNGLKLLIDADGDGTISDTEASQAVTVVIGEGASAQTVSLTVMLKSKNPSFVHPVDNTPAGYIWINDVADGSETKPYTDDEPSFVINLPVGEQNADGTQKYPADAIIHISYAATVTTDLGVLVNTAHLVSNDLIKDAQTRNYTSKITVDKYETGNASQKLAGAEFVLYKTTTTPQTKDINSLTYYQFEEDGKVYWNTQADGTGAWKDADENDVAAASAPTSATAVYKKAYYQFNKTTNKVTWLTVDNDTDLTTIAENADILTDYDANITKKVTKTDGGADFTGLEDGTYYLVEIKAPSGYVKLETPVPVIVNGKASLDQNNTVEDNPEQTTTNQNIHLRNVSHIANTPGSVLPSTGGRGTTMLYMAGLGMMLAAGAFLIFRRRAEAGK